jgi:hypothetical protein
MVPMRPELVQTNLMTDYACGIARLGLLEAGVGRKRGMGPSTLIGGEHVTLNGEGHDGHGGGVDGAATLGLAVHGRIE